MKTEITKCPKCEKPVTFKESGSTMVAYGGYSAPHDHDDNCELFLWVCEDGHYVQLREQNVCPVEECGWKGKTDCFCSTLGVSVFDQDWKKILDIPKV